jgi:hypothetical protein
MPRNRMRLLALAAIAVIGLFGSDSAGGLKQ